MKKLFILVAVLLGVGSVSAQKLARINVQEVVMAMPEFEEAQKNLEAFGKDLNEQMEQIQVEFNNKLADFQKNQATMAASVKQMRQQELEQLQQRFSEFQQIAQQDFQKKQAELTRAASSMQLCSSLLLLVSVQSSAKHFPALQLWALHLHSLATSAL